MNFIRHRVAAVLCAASLVCFAGPALAAGQAGAAPAPGQQGPEDSHHWRGPGMDGMGPEAGPHGFGEHGHGMHGGMHGGMLEHLQRLNLSEAQRDKLFSIRHNAEPEFRERMKAIHKAHQALAEVARADRFDDARAAALSRELGQAIAAAALLKARTEAQALAVLSPEQREQLRRHRTPGPQIRPGRPE